MLKNPTNLRNIQRLIRFFSRDNDAGYLFAYPEKTAKSALITEVNRHLKKHFEGENKNIGLLFLDKDDDLFITKRIEVFLKDNEFKALIIANLDDVVSDKEKGGNFLTELNFARESFYKFNLPILFWISEESFPLISNGAPDLYSQRKLSSLVFENETQLSLPIFDINNSKLLLLLKEQFETAVAQKMPETQIANEYLLPYLIELANLGKKKEAIILYGKYKEFFNLSNPRRLKELGDFFRIFDGYERAIEYYSEALNLISNEETLFKTSLLGLIGTCYYFSSDYKNALKFYKLVKEKHLSVKGNEQATEEYEFNFAINISHLADIYEKLDKLDLALLNSIESSKRFKVLNEKYSHNEKYNVETIKANIRLGDLQSKVGNVKDALKTYRLNLELIDIKEILKSENTNSDDISLKINSIFSIGEAYFALDNLEKAKIHYEKYVDLCKGFLKEYPNSDSSKNNFTIANSRLGVINRMTSFIKNSDANVIILRDSRGDITREIANLQTKQRLKRWTWTIFNFSYDILGIISFMVVIAGFYLLYPSMKFPILKKIKVVVENITKPNANQPTNEESTLPYLALPFTPNDSVLNVLILRFEDYIASTETACIGASIETNLIQLSKKMPLNPIYADFITSPKRSEVAKAKEIQEKYNADVLIYGLVNQLQENCQGVNICFRHIIADVIMNNIKVPKTINKVKDDLQYEDISPFEIEQGKLSVNEKSMEAWLASLIALKADDKEDALTQIEKIVDVDDPSLTKEELAEQYLQRGKTYFDLKEYKLSIMDYKKAIDLNLKSADYYIYRGLSYSKLGEVELSIKDYTKAIELSQEHDIVYYNRGISYDELGKYELAIKDYTKSIKLNPENADAYNRRGLIYSNLGKYKLAIKDYTKSIKLNPENADAYNRRGLVYDNLGEYNLSIKDYAKAIELNLQNDYAYNNFAYAYLKIDNPIKAKKYLTISQKLDDTNSWVYRNWACYYNLKGERKQAIQNLEKAIDLGYNDKEWIENEPLLESLKSHSKYKQILNKISKK